MQDSYELMLMLQPQLSEQEEKKILKLIETGLKENGKVISSNRIGKKQLVYQIKKNTEAVYWLLKLEIMGKEAKGLINRFKQEEKILRFLLLRQSGGKRS